MNLVSACESHGRWILGGAADLAMERPRRPLVALRQGKDLGLREGLSVAD